MNNEIMINEYFVSGMGLLGLLGLLVQTMILESSNVLS